MTSDEERMVICEEEGDDDVIGKQLQGPESYAGSSWLRFGGVGGDLVQALRPLPFLPFHVRV